jgi:hypothetical protein
MTRVCRVGLPNRYSLACSIFCEALLRGYIHLGLGKKDIDNRKLETI